MILKFHEKERLAQELGELTTTRHCQGVRTSQLELEERRSNSGPITKVDLKECKLILPYFIDKIVSNEVLFTSLFSITLHLEKLFLSLLKKCFVSKCSLLFCKKGILNVFLTFLTTEQGLAFSMFIKFNDIINAYGQKTLIVVVYVDVM